jgi:hypothetical protein
VLCVTNHAVCSALSSRRGLEAVRSDDKFWARRLTSSFFGRAHRNASCGRMSGERVVPDDNRLGAPALQPRGRYHASCPAALGGELAVP